jgi:hypothetical protein
MARVSGLEENPNCEYTHASFRLVGNDLQPDVVELRTGLTGDFGAQRDMLRSSRTGRAVRQPTGVWFITSENRVGSTSVERHLIYLLERVEPIQAELLAVIEEQRLRADFLATGRRQRGRAGRK